MAGEGIAKWWREEKKRGRKYNIVTKGEKGVTDDGGKIGRRK